MWLCGLLPIYFEPKMAPRSSGMSTTTIFPLVFTTLSVLGLVSRWLYHINTIVPEPYLDEVFHVRQARAYWEHRWRQWDPKITTPPGLYLVSYMIGTLIYATFRYPPRPVAADMRCVNGLVLLNLLPIPLRSLLNNLWRKGLRLRAPRLVVEWELSLTALNICIFPPVFFFSGLYYTDLAALLVVVHVYAYDLQRLDTDTQALQGEKGSSSSLISWRSLVLVLNGILALSFRQTNIFWVAVFLGGLRLIKEIKRVSADCKATETAKIVRNSFELRQIFDLPVRDACIEDYFKTSFSLVAAALSNIRIAIATLLPYLAILGAFGLFVFWNGGVVLGHKEFHTASLHLPQMFYIWPYFIFFSWPIIFLPGLLHLWSTPLLKFLTLFVEIMPRFGLMLCLATVIFAVVHVNTIVHPFTLADNRHYVFYVFRILLRHPLVKYAVVPIYLLCATFVLGAFGPLVRSRNTSKTKSADGPSSKTTAHEAVPPNSGDDVRVSFVLVWLVSTTLSLITAPLVEPRYFIIPWVLWRIHIPPSSFSLGSSPKQSTTAKGSPDSNGGESDDAVSPALYIRFLPLIAEFMWFLLINGVTGHVFLRKGFEWPQEPGQVQRFLW